MVLQTTGLRQIILHMLVGNQQQATYGTCAWYLHQIKLINTPTDVRPESKTSSTAAFQTLNNATINSSVSLGNIQLTNATAVTSANNLHRTQTVYRKNEGAGTNIVEYILFDSRASGLDMTSIAPRIIININLRRR